MHRFCTSCLAALALLVVPTLGCIVVSPPPATGEGEGERRLGEGEGEDPSEGEGERPSEGEGEGPSEGEGEDPSEGEGEGSCFENFWLAQTFYVDHSVTFGHACNDNTNPTNCRDGLSIHFEDTGECVCILSCSSLQGVSLGDNCTKDGAWTCQEIVNASGNSQVRACVPQTWDLCTTGGTEGEGEPSEGEGEPGEGEGEICADFGDACEWDDECCSGDCFFDACE